MDHTTKYAKCIADCLVMKNNCSHPGLIAQHHILIMSEKDLKTTSILKS